MVLQRVENFVHLERRRDGLDQHGDLDRTVGEAEPRLRPADDLVPQRGLGGAFELGDVIISARPGGGGGGSVVDEVEREIDEGAG